ncbi:MAG: D-2-hydroxyacid dehydrogenase [Burkholderiales bacterium]|nr:D-2-hydroxyacid dehydrogenase [Burkholderiales bacterium]
MGKPVCVLWVDDAPAYRAALARLQLEDRFELHDLKRDASMPDELAARTEVLVGWQSGSYLQRMPRLRWIQAMTAGVESWLEAPGLSHDVLISCARGSHRDAVAENILGALFHLTKPYMAIALDQRESRWTRRQSITLAGKTLGILGLGAIGQELAAKAGALDMRIIGSKRTPDPVAHVDKVYGPEALHEVLRQSDFVVLLLPTTPITENIVDATFLRAMKSSAWLINFGRGALVTDEDLIAAVRSKTIAGAVLDVFREEPLPKTHPFWTTEGILVLPHIGGGHPQRGTRVAEIFATNAKRFLAGEALVTGVDRARGY